MPISIPQVRFAQCHAGFVQRGIADDILARMKALTEAMHVGDPMADDVNMGALISAPHLKKVLGYVEKGVLKVPRL